MGDFLKSLAVILGIVGTCFGAYFFIDRTYAEKSQLVSLELRVVTNELHDLLRRAQADMYFYKEQLRKFPNDVDVIKRLKNAEAQVEELRDRIKNLKKKGDSGL